eukprot:TRINITY_DN4601_c0_g1_i4.p1 TRINITY_DN4601_c0_g1~~TRINITY_DN4601_c0_g1_i4.p1  ORF type:complete len:221 (-),score=50.21 TRINITY_DN4601_c0_g1_i4:39-701(-)
MELGALDAIVESADVTVQADCERLMKKVVAAWGGIDILVLNAGAGAIFPFSDITDLSVFNSNMDINFIGPVYCTYFALPHLKKSHGSIVVVSSLAGKIGAPNRTAYSASKHAVQGFFNALRCEVGSQVQVTIVCPGFVKSDFHAKVATGGSGLDVARENKHFMTTEECAHEIFTAERTREREVILTTIAKVGKYVAPFFPELIDYVAIKKNNASMKNKNH